MGTSNWGKQVQIARALDDYRESNLPSCLESILPVLVMVAAIITPLIIIGFGGAS